MSIHEPQIVVVGGSLAGLTLALACATRDIPVQVVERATERTQGGDSLIVDLATIASTTGHDPRNFPNLPVVPAYRDRHLATWPALYGWLRNRVSDNPNIFMHEGKSVSAVRNVEDKAELFFEDGSQLLADAVFGADGYKSVIRQTMTPETPFARYAGYIVWRGLVDEKKLSKPVPWDSNKGLWIELVNGYRLVAAVLPGRNGSTEVGKRQITFAWFDAYRDDLLRSMNRLSANGDLLGTLGNSAIDTDLRNDLLFKIPALWPDIWVEAVTVGVQSSNLLSGAPIAEYMPSRMAKGPLALVGDAAHVMSPMTGSGFATGVDDAAVLSRVLVKSHASHPVGTALQHYEAIRLPYVRALISHSHRLSTDFMKYARGDRQQLG